MANLGSKTLTTTRNLTDRFLVTQSGDSESKEALPKDILSYPETEQTDDYVLELTDGFTTVIMNKGTAVNLTVPPNSSVAFPVGTMIAVRRIGAGELTFVAGSGVTINSSLGALTDADQYALMLLTKTGTNTWYLDNGIAFSITSADITGALGYTPSKTILLYKEVTPATHTGDTTETVLGQYLVPAGTIQATDILVIRARAAKTGTAGSYNVRLRIGSLGTTGDAQCGIASPGATQQHTYFKRDIHFIDSVASQEVLLTSLNAATDEQTSSALPSALSIDFSSNQYISITMNLNNGGDTAILKYLYLTIIRA